MKNKEGYPDPTASRAINGVRWEELQRMREKKYGIKRGETIELKFAERQEDGKNIRIRTRKMKVIKLYEHHVLLESQKGIRECMSYWKLDRCLSKTGGDSLET